MAEIKLKTAVREMSEFFVSQGIDGTFQYVGNGSVLIRSRHFKNDKELYDPDRAVMFIKGRTVPVEEIQDSSYPALVARLEDLLKCKYQRQVSKSISYIVDDVQGFDIIDEACVLSILKIEDIPLAITAVEVSERYLELEIDNIESIKDRDIYKAICPMTTSSCIIDRTNSVVTVRITSVLEKMLPNRQIKIVDGRAFISKEQK